MRVGVLSDIHGNCHALDRVLEDLERRGVDVLVCLGDAIQGGPQPAEVVQRLRELEIPTVLGNSDAWLLTGEDTETHPIPEERRKTLDTVRQWSLGQLSPPDQEFIGSFQPTIEIPLEHGQKLFCFHGSPTSFDQFILPSTPEEEFEGLLGQYGNFFLAGGHMHLQFTRRLRDRMTFFFNPGSVGIAYNHVQVLDKGLLDPWAEYAVLTARSLEVSLEFSRVPIDLERMAEVYRKSTMPFAERAMDRYLRYGS
ncbi:MAG TPA: metallophosphoesterase family protein [Anaerolineales bacterium]|nr:metallophosphoesterase family protein [Anaerolineales bacterium]